MTPGGEDLLRQTEVQKQAIQDLTQSTDNSATAMDRHKDKLSNLNKEFQLSTQIIRNDFTKALDAALVRGQSFQNVFDKLRVSLEAFALQRAVITPLADALFGSKNGAAGDNEGSGLASSGGGLLGSLTSSLVDLFAARAQGGPVGAGTPYLVGERGPELFVPQTAGRINPGACAGNVNITMHVHAKDASSFRASQAQIAASMMDAARRATRIR